MTEEKRENTTIVENEEQIEVCEQTSQSEQEWPDTERRSGEDRREFSIEFEGSDKRSGEDRRKENQGE